MERILDKGRLGAWVAALADWTVLAPAMQDGLWAYRPVAGGEASLTLGHPNTVQPPKGQSFPQREVFFTFDETPDGQPRLTPLVPRPGPRLVFGVRPCDGQGLTHLDQVFGEEAPDAYYQARRGTLAYVGLACNSPPSRHCFCTSVGGSPFGEAGLDVLMIDLSDRYLVRALTPVGETLMTAGQGVLTEAGADDRAEAQQRRLAALAHPQRTVAQPQSVPERLKAGFGSALWERLAQPCIGCGICTFLCPTCHCFDINDEVASQSPVCGSRVRTWDSCQFPDFTMHTSGHNPRADLGARLRQRVSHKFLYYFENHGVFQCTGCGRCIIACPVGIDIIAVVNQVAAEAAAMPPADS
ncbi:4Fe-4S dicluster domain-containing protein [uncultured Thiodictyon sp.]|uniref:4Fe-4S dicluster domain-containing protein n=1 Tax=uncultured Thiodictyon sp. TaxID=1846217 RepID=UPI0025ECD953|nr:4Fe-4S dicluster domain-containing protein [uncultured Thiodictyon sp.]